MTLTPEQPEVATCRHCRRELKGKPYYMGGPAYDPRTNERVPVNYYGGFVCSPECDYRASLALESDMPGAGRATRISQQAQACFNRNWSNT